MTSVSDLPPELLSLIGRRLHTAVDVVRFHAVCTEWRQSMRYLPPTPPDQPLPVAAALLPWLLAPSSTSESDDASAGVACRCVFSKTSYHAPGVCFRHRRVAHADGTGSWLIDGVLVNPLSGWIDIDPVKQYPWKWIDGKVFCHCVVSDDGSFLVYCLSPDWGLQGRLSITGYTWIPGKREGGWVSGLPGAAGCGVVYHRGATVSVDLANCYIHKKDLLWLRNTSMPLPDEPGKVRQRSYLLELGGEVLLASVLKDADCTDDDDDRLSVSVHAFDVDAALYAVDPDAAMEEAEPAAAAPASPVWEKRDNVLGDHILFLGYPGSFAAEAARFDGDVPGGSAYFVVRSEPCRVYRYSFVDGGGGTAAATTTSTSTLVETLPAGWNDERCMWFLPLPGIVDPILTEEEEEDAARANQQQQQRDLRIYVNDLSPKVDSCRLREMYSKHGKVVQARVAYDKRGRSRGFGFVTMATQEGFDRALGRCNAVEKPDYPLSTTEIVFGLCLLVLFLFLAYYIIACFCRLISRWM